VAACRAIRDDLRLRKGPRERRPARGHHWRISGMVFAWNRAQGKPIQPAERETNRSKAASQAVA